MINNEQFNMNVENNSTTRKGLNPILIGGLVVILLVLFGVGGWMLGVQYAESEEKNNENDTKEVIDKDTDKKENDNNEDKNKVTITEDDVKKIYSLRVPILEKNMDGVNAYQNKKVDVNTLDENLLRGFAFWNIDFKDGDISSFINEDGTLMCEDLCSFDDLWGEGWFIFDAGLLQASAKELYGQEIKNGDFNDSIGSGATFENGKYHHSAGGGTIVSVKYYREFVSYEVTDDALIVTDSFIKFVVTPNDNTEDYTIKVYTDSNNSKLLDTKNSQYDAYDKEFDTIIENNYKDDMIEYKHIFKKDDTGNWYWVSTEPVK